MMLRRIQSTAQAALVLLVLVNRVALAQMSPFDDELSQQLRGVHSPMISPDGRLVAYVRTTSDVIGRTLTSEVVIVNVADRKERAVLPGRAPQWNATGSELTFTVTQTGRIDHWLRTEAVVAPIPRADASTRTPTPLAYCECTVREFSFDNSGHIAAFVRSSITEPPDVYTFRLDTADTPKPLTRINARVVQEAILTKAAIIRLSEAADSPWHVFVLPPAAIRPGKEYAALLAVRAGSHAPFGYDFSDRFQLLATRGYGVIYVETSSAGADSALSLGLAAAIQRNPWIDTTRLGVIGDGDSASAQWIARHHARFNRATNLAGLLWRRDVRVDQYFSAVFMSR